MTKKVQARAPGDGPSTSFAKAPLLLHDELLAELVRNSRFQSENRKHLEAYGWPPVQFRGTTYIFKFLQLTYATKVAPVFKDGVPQAIVDKPGSLRLAKRPDGDTVIALQARVPYAQASALPGLPWSPALCRELERLRPKVVDARLRVLEVLASHLFKGKPAGLFQGSMAVIKEELGSAEVFKTLLKADLAWTDMALGDAFESFTTRVPFNAALSRLFAMVELVEFELETGTYSRSRDLARGLHVLSDGPFIGFTGKADRVADFLDTLAQVETASTDLHRQHRADFAARLSDYWRGTWQSIGATNLSVAFNAASRRSDGLSRKDHFKNLVCVGADCRSVSVDGKLFAKLSVNAASFFDKVLRSYLTAAIPMSYEKAAEELNEDRRSDLRFQSLLKDNADLRKVVEAIKGTRLLVGLARALRDREIFWQGHSVEKIDGQNVIKEV